MKRQAALFLLTLVVAQAVAGPVRLSFKRQQEKQITSARGSELKLCGVCIQFAGEFINQLLNIILNAGVVGGCGEICGILADKTGSKTVGTVCNLLCDIVGIEEFVKLIEKADLDPIYYCELMRLCEVKDDGDATINSITITPQSGPQGKFKIDVQFTTKNGTGTGEAVLEIQTLDGVPVGDNELNEPMDPGTYDLSWTLDAEPDPSCDPTQGPCENWMPGNYTAAVAICNGQCGSKHPHSQIYTQDQATFAITGGK